MTWSRREMRKTFSWFFLHSSLSYDEDNHNTTVYVCRCHVYSFRHLFQPQTLLDSSGEVILNIPEHFLEFPVHTTRTTGTMENAPSVSSSDTLATTAWEMEAASTSAPLEMEGTDTYSTYCEVMDKLPKEQDPEIQEAIFQSSRASLTNENDRYYHRSEMFPCFTLPNLSCTVPGVNRCSESPHLPVQLFPSSGPTSAPPLLRIKVVQGGELHLLGQWNWPFGTICHVPNNF